MNEQEYAGFWIRTGAAIIDTILILIIIIPVLHAIYGVDYWVSESFVAGFWGFILQYILPAIAVVIFLDLQIRNSWENDYKADHCRC